MVISAGGKKRRTGAESLRELQAQHIAIKTQCTFKVGDLQVDVADADVWVDRSDGVFSAMDGALRLLAVYQMNKTLRTPRKSRQEELEI